MEKPRVVTLCGSTRFMDEFAKAARRLTLNGNIVLTVGALGDDEKLQDGPIKVMLDELHLRKIDISDEILVINQGGYIGDSTRREIEYAISKGKTVRYKEGVS